MNSLSLDLENFSEIHYRFPLGQTETRTGRGEGAVLNEFKCPEGTVLQRTELCTAFHGVMFTVHCTLQTALKMDREHLKAFHKVDLNIGYIGSRGY